jgi:hypothetical protein
MKILPLKCNGQNRTSDDEVIYLYFAFHTLLPRNEQNTHVIHNELDFETFP